MVPRPLQNLGGDSLVVSTLGWPQRDLTIVGNSLPTQNKLIGSPTLLKSFGRARTTMYTKVTKHPSSSSFSLLFLFLFFL